MMSDLSDQQLLRYSRHILLDDIGIEGQHRISNGRILIVGAGGLGCACALYLAAAGVGTITLVDDDVVDLTNLQRQVGHATQRIGHKKVESLAHSLRAINPDCQVVTFDERATESFLHHRLPLVDVVIDCSDNYQTRHMINAACVLHRKPLVSGAAIRFDGQLAVFDSRHAQSACYACIFSPDAAFEETRCATMGVFSPLVGMVGSLQASETLKLLLERPEQMTNRLWLVNAKTMDVQEIQLQRQKGCSVCGTSHG